MCERAEWEGCCEAARWSAHVCGGAGKAGSPQLIPPAVFATRAVRWTFHRSAPCSPRHTTRPATCHHLLPRAGRKTSTTHRASPSQPHQATPTVRSTNLQCEQGTCCSSWGHRRPGPALAPRECQEAAPALRHGCGPGSSCHAAAHRTLAAAAAHAAADTRQHRVCVPEACVPRGQAVQPVRCGGVHARAGGGSGQVSADVSRHVSSGQVSADVSRHVSSGQACQHHRHQCAPPRGCQAQALLRWASERAASRCSAPAGRGMATYAAYVLSSSTRLCTCGTGSPRWCGMQDSPAPCPDAPAPAPPPAPRYLTMSSSGVTSVTPAEASFTPLERFQREYQLHTALHKLRMFRCGAAAYQPQAHANHRLKLLGTAPGLPGAAPSTGTSSHL
jgi:hypothetical protein